MAQQQHHQRHQSRLPLITNDQELEIALFNTLQPNSHLVKLASRQLSRFCSDPSCVEPMVRQMQRSSDVSIRQLVATLLRQRISEYWDAVGRSERDSMKQGLLQMLLQETDSRVRTAIVGLVSEIAAVELTTGAWPELSQFMVQCTQSQQSTHRQMGLTMFGRLIEALPQQMMSGNNMENLLQMFTVSLLQDADLEVRLAALRAVESLSLKVESEEEVESMLKLISPVMQVIQQCIASAQATQSVIDSFQIFDNLLEKRVKSFDKVLLPLIKFMVDVSLNRSLDLALRDRALDFITWTVSYKPKLFIQHNLIPPILDMVFALLSEPEQHRSEGEDDEEDDDMDEVTMFSSASALLDELARDIPSKHTFSHIMERAMTHINSTDAFRCRSGIASLGIIAEGCSVSMTKQLDRLMPMLLSAAEHESIIVRENAFLSLASFSEFLVPDVVRFHELVMPSVIKGLTANPPRIVRKICNAIDAFSEYLGVDIVPYLKPLMETLLTLLTRSDCRTQESIIPTIANVAHAAEKEVTPYFTTIAHFCKQLMEHTRDSRDHSMLNLRARATECIGIVAIAVGKLTFTEEWINGFMTLAMEGLALDHIELREMTFSFFSSIACMLGVEFDRYLPTAMNPVLQSVCTEEGDFEKRIGKKDSAVTAEQILLDAERHQQQQEDTNDDDEEESDDGDDDNDGMKPDQDAADVDNIHTALIDERAAAIKAIGSFAKSCGDSFSHYLDNSFQAVLLLLEHYHFVVRRQVVPALRDMVYVLIPENAANVNLEALPKDKITALTKMLDILMEEYVSIMRNEYDKETVARTCECARSLIQQLGVRIIDKHINPLCESLLSLLKKDAECNRTVDSDDDDHDIVLGDSVGDVISTMAAAYGQQFEPYFRVFLPVLMRYMRPNRDDEDRRFGLGTVAECANAMQSAIEPHVQSIVPYALAGIAQQEQSQDVKRNAVYLVGVLFQHAKQPMAQLVNKVLQDLHPIFANQDEFDDPVVDNVCCTVAKMIMSYGDSLPLGLVVPTLLSALPLREDYMEYGPVFDCLEGLIQRGNEQVTNSSLPAVLALFADLATHQKGNLPGEQLQRLPGMVRLLMRHIGGFDRFASALSASVKDDLQRNIMLHMAQS